MPKLTSLQSFALSGFSAVLPGLPRFGRILLFRASGISDTAGLRHRTIRVTRVRPLQGVAAVKLSEVHGEELLLLSCHLRKQA